MEADPPLAFGMTKAYHQKNELTGLMLAAENDLSNMVARLLSLGADMEIQVGTWLLYMMDLSRTLTYLIMKIRPRLD